MTNASGAYLEIVRGQCYLSFQIRADLILTVGFFQKIMQNMRYLRESEFDSGAALVGLFSEFASSEISQTLHDFLEYLNRLNTFYTNLKVQIILPPTVLRIDTGHIGHAKIEISQRIRTTIFWSI